MHLHTTWTLALAAALCCIFQPVTSHTWVEQLTLIAPNGTFIGEAGFPRGNVRRGTAGFGDPAMTYLLPRPGSNKILPTDNICKESQRERKQTEGSPRLKAPPGAAVALRYQENGHVSLPDAQLGKPPNRGFVYVYGTTDPRPDDSLLSIHNVWNADGTGGDGRGLLLSRQNYDDGRCYQVNGDKISRQRQIEFAHEPDEMMGGDLWCQQDIALPANAPVGKPYTLYWVWDWPTAAGVDPGLPDGKAETYTTCMDVDIVAKNTLATFLRAAGSRYVSDQPLNRAAIPSQMAALDLGIKIPNIDGGRSSRTTLETVASPTPTTLDTVPSPFMTRTRPPAKIVTRTTWVTATRTRTVDPPSIAEATEEPTSTSVAPSSATSVEAALADTTSTETASASPTSDSPSPAETTSTSTSSAEITPSITSTEVAPADPTAALRFNRDGYRTRPSLSERDLTYPEYSRRASSESGGETFHDDFEPPKYRSPRLPARDRPRRFFLW